MPRPDRNPWTKEQIATMRAMRARGCSFQEIAAEVNHTARACYNKAYALGIRRIRANTRFLVTIGAARLASEMRAKSTLRPCLCCRQSFPSQGPHNRLCKNCRRQDNDTVFTVPAVVMR